jgi:transcriptional regulator of arginine metabolism
MPQPADIRDQRRAAILDILTSRPVARQAEFVTLLQDKGFEATQSSVSRDLRELGISKLDRGYGRIETNAGAGTRGAGLESAGFVRDILPAGNNLTVVHTAVGAAQRVAVFLDRSDWPEIVGTVSGDDTIFVATRNKQDQRKLISRLQNTLQDNQ